MLVYLFPLIASLLTSLYAGTEGSIVVPVILTGVCCFFPVVITSLVKNLYPSHPRGISLPEDRTVVGMFFAGVKMIILYFTMLAGWVVLFELTSTPW